MAKIIHRKSTEHNEFHYVYGTVYVPGEIDSHFETFLPKDVMKMAHDFVSKGLASHIDTLHDMLPNGCVAVESFIARDGDPDFKPGSWVLGVRIKDGTQTWNDIREGKLNGFSLAAFAPTIKTNVVIDRMVSAFGMTEENSNTESTPVHKHEYYIEFNEDGAVSFAATDEVEGHSHTIKTTTATESYKDHGHRFFLE